MLAFLAAIDWTWIDGSYKAAEIAVIIALGVILVGLFFVSEHAMSLLSRLGVALVVTIGMMALGGHLSHLSDGHSKSAALVALITVAVILIGLFFVAGATLTMPPPSGAPPRWPTALLWSFACLAVGGLLGFIFGVPRAPTLTSLTVPKYSRPKPASPTGPSGPTNAGGSPAAPDATSIPAASGSTGATGNETPYQPNSNLEEISDWLTKILVGMGLSQWPAIKNQLRTVMTLLANGLGGDSAQPLALGIVMYFATIGFLSVYLLTRLFISNALEAQGG